MRWKFNLNF